MYAKPNPPKDSPNPFLIDPTTPEDQISDYKRAERSILYLLKSEERASRLRFRLEKKSSPQPLAGNKDVLDPRPPPSELDTSPVITISIPLDPSPNKYDNSTATERQSGNTLGRLVYMEVSPLFFAVFGHSLMLK